MWNKKDVCVVQMRMTCLPWKSAFKTSLFHQLLTPLLVLHKVRESSKIVLYASSKWVEPSVLETRPLNWNVSLFSFSKYTLKFKIETATTGAIQIDTKKVRLFTKLSLAQGPQNLDAQWKSLMNELIWEVNLL